MSAVLQEREVDAIEMKSSRVEVDLPVTAEMQKLARPSGALAVAQAYEVDCAEIAQTLANERIGWAKRIDAITAMEKDFMSPVKKAVEDMKAKVEKWFGPTKADYVAARDLAGQKLLKWDQDEKARVAREQAERDAVARRLRQEAEAKAAAERARAEEVARQAREAAQRAEDERKRQEDEARRAREAGDKQAAAEAERKAKAAAAESAKQQEREHAAVQNGAASAARIQTEAAAVAMAQPAVQEVQTIAGQSTKENWVAVLADGETEYTALEKIICAIAGVEKCAGRLDLMAHLSLDTAPRGSLNKQAAAQKGHMRVPGYRAENQPLLAGKRK